MARLFAVAGILVGLVSALVAAPITVPPISPQGCQVGVIIIGSVPVNCSSTQLLLTVLDPNLAINYSGTALELFTALKSIQVDVTVADNRGLISGRGDAALEGGQVFFAVNGHNYGLGTFGGSPDGLNANPVGNALVLHESVAPGDLANIFADLHATGFAFSILVSRSSGNFNVIDPAHTDVMVDGLPEPATFGVVGFGLIGLCWLLRKRMS
jgi:hypothetical protein